MKKRFSPAVVIAAVAAFFTTVTFAQAHLKIANGAMVEASGMTLHTFDNDKAGSGKSVCNGQCAALWPPLIATAEQPAGD